MRISEANEYQDADLGLVREIVVGDNRDGNELQSLPGWINFLIRCGYLLRTRQFDDARIVIALLLPTRELAAAFASLGIILGSLKTTVEFLTWEQLLTLPEGTEVYVRFRHRNSNRSLKGKVGEKKHERSILLAAPPHINDKILELGRSCFLQCGFEERFFSMDQNNVFSKPS